MTRKTRVIIIAIFLAFMGAANIIFFLRLSADVDRTISLRFAAAAVIAVILAPFTLYAGFRYVPHERRIPVFVVIIAGAILLKTMPIGSFLSVLALATLLIVAICAGIFWPNRNSASIG